MLPSKNKVGKDLFPALMKEGRSYHFPGFSARVFVVGSGRPKFSVVVPKQVEKSAVKRNAIKRRVYAIVRPFLKTAKPGIVCSVFVKKRLDKADIPILARDLAEALKKAGVIA